MPLITRRRFAGFGLAAGASGVFAPHALASDPTGVVLLLNGVINDAGWGQLAYGGLKALEAQPGFKVACAENVAAAQIAQVVRAYAGQGYKLVIGHGFEFARPLLELARELPATKFFVSSLMPQPKVPANILYADLAYIDVAYAAGSLAALISEKKKAVGFVGGGDNPTQHKMLKAFIVGAEAALPELTGLGIVTGDYNSAARGRRAAATMIGNGADVIWHAADLTGVGAIQACVDAKVKAIGCYADQTGLAPAQMATSFELNLSGMVQTIGKAVADGSFKGGTEWKPSVAQMWLPRAGSHGDRNPRLVTAEAWKEFQAVWSDVARRRINVTLLLK